MQTLRNIHASRQGGGNRSGTDAANTLTTKEAFTSGTKIRSGDDCQVHDLSPHEGQHYEYNLKPEGNIRIRPAAGHRIAILEQDNPTTGADRVGVLTCQRASKNGILEDLEVKGNIAERDERLVKTHVPNFHINNNYFKPNRVKFNFRIWEYISDTPNIKINPGSDATVWKDIEPIVHAITGVVHDGIDNKMDCVWMINGAGVGFLASNYGTRGELNGCISAMNGFINQNGSMHGHGFYIQNGHQPGWKKDYNSTAFFNARLGVQYYGTNPIERLDSRGFWGFLNGAINPFGWVEQNILIGSTKEDRNIIFYDAIGYEQHKRNMQYGWQSKIFEVDAKDGYFWGGTTVVTHMRNYTSNFVGETVVQSERTDLLRYIFVESWFDFQQLTFSNNVYYADKFRIQIQFRNGERPSQIFTSLSDWQQYSGKDLNSIHLPLSAHPNLVKYRVIKPHVAKISLINPQKEDFMAVNLSNYGLTHGLQYEVRDMQNLLNDYVLRFTYNSSNPVIHLPTTMTEVMPIFGRGPKQPVHTDKEFNAFLLFPEEWRNTPHHNGTSAPVYQAPITAIDAPSNLQVNISGYTASVSWINANSGYDTELRVTNSSTGIFVDHAVSPGEMSKTIGELDPGTNYCFAVRHIFGSIQSAYTDDVCATTEPAPLALPVINRVAIVGKTGIEIRDLINNDTIDIDLIGNDFSFEIFTNEYVESVEIVIGAFRLVENNARWAAFGNTGNVFRTWMEMAAQNSSLADPVDGSPHTMSITGYSAKNATGTASTQEIFNFDIIRAAPNEPPVLVPVGDQVINTDEILELEFIVQDEDPENLVFYFEENNLLIESITFALSSIILDENENPIGANMVATITPKPGITGSEIVRIYASDGVNAPGYLEFNLTVEPVLVETKPPSLPFFPNITIGVNSKHDIHFNVTDEDTAISEVETEVYSIDPNNEVILPENMEITGTGSTRMLRIISTEKTGDTILVVRAKDGDNETFETFMVSVKKGRKKTNAKVAMVGAA